MKQLYKRLIAYLIDILITSIIITAVLYLPVFTNEKINYQKYSKEYSDEYLSYITFNNDLNKYYQDKKITKQEYSKLEKKHPKYIKYLDKYYDDQTIKSKEYKIIVKDINDNWKKVYTKMNYKINKHKIANNIISFIVLIGYFLSINIITRGQTIGKKIMKLKIVNNNDEEKTIPPIKYLIRIIILYNPIYYLLITIGMFSFKMNSFYTWSYIIAEIKNYLEIIIIIMLIVRKDNRGLHELLSNTKVVSTEITGSKDDKESKDITLIKKNNSPKIKKSIKNKKIIVNEE